MKFLKRIVARWAREGNEDAEAIENGNYYPSSNSVMPRKKSIGHLTGDQGTGPEFKNPMNITLYNAVGGRIVKFSRWDRTNDTTLETTYVVNNDDDFEKALAGFIALEALKYVN